MTIQPQNNNLNYLIDPTFTNVNRLFVLSFQRIAGENNTLILYIMILKMILSHFIMYQM